MQVRFIGILPVVITNTGSSDTHAETRGIWIAMPKSGGSEELYRHELTHVRQFYLYMVPLVVLVAAAAFVLSATAALGVFLVGLAGYAAWSLTTWGILSRESAAYAESARVRVFLGDKRDTAINSVTELLANRDAYRVTASKEEIKRRIEARFDDKRLY